MIAIIILASILAGINEHLLVFALVAGVIDILLRIATNQLRSAKKQ